MFSIFKQFLMDMAHPLLQLLCPLTILQYNLVGWIFRHCPGNNKIIKCKDYLYERNSPIITVLVNFRKIPIIEFTEIILTL